MIRGRKFKIWSISFCIVIAVFIFYKMVGQDNIKVPTFNYKPDANVFSSEPNYGPIGPVGIGDVCEARFETYNPKTRKLERVIGFQKVLHKSGDMWELDKPFMSVYQDNVRCDITADKGNVELDNVQSAKPSPKEADLKGNVVVHIFGQDKRSEAFIYLNEVIFDDDRSMLWSNDSINFVSKEAVLLGKGIEIVYNTSISRLEFMKIKKLDYLNIMKPVKQLANDNNTAVEPNKAVSSSDTNAPKVKKQSDPNKPQQKKKKKKDEDYRCIFRDNVRIEYKEEVVLAEEISISNLLVAQNNEKPKKKDAEFQIVKAADVNETKKVKKAKDSNQPLDKKTNTKIVKAPKETPIQISPDSNVMAIVKCDGPMIIRPVDSKEYENWKPAQYKGFKDLDAPKKEFLGNRNLLIAQTIDYNLGNDTANTKGKVELVFYPQVQTDTGKQKVPFIISAEQGAQFSVPNKQAIFFDHVQGAFTKQTPAFDEENMFFGSKLIADLAAKQGSEDLMASSDISHIKIEGPNVRLESKRTKGETKLSHVRLKSEQLDYDRTTQQVVTSGKGKIEYSNTGKISATPVVSVKKAKLTDTNQQAEDTPQMKTDKPCFALVEGFNSLVWDMNSHHVRATSDKSSGIHVGYLPILETGYGPRTTIDTKQIDVDYNEPAAGKSQVTKLVASGGIVFREDGGNEFAGDKLNYNPAQEYMKITGSDALKCMLNGVTVEGIDYDMKAGTANATGAGIGIMPMK